MALETLFSISQIIIKKKVDSYKGGRRIPSCQLQVKLNKDQPPDDVHKKVILHGAKEPLNCITIQSDLLPSGMWKLCIGLCG